MTPILFERNETEYLNNGIGRLSDAVSCIVEENLNGSYELMMKYPLEGQHFSEITEDRIILAEPYENGTWQPFRIYKVSRPLNGTVTIYAEHISYLLNKIVVMPYTATSCAQALSKINANVANTCPFTFTTDKTTSGNFTVDYPRAVRGLLGGESGSILDVYGKGEYQFDRFNVYLHLNRGTDKGVTLRYGKNITDMVRDSDIQNVYTGIVPYWQNEEQTVTLPEKVVYSDYRHSFAYDIIIPVDFSTNFENPPTVEQLRSAAQSYVVRNEGWKIAENIKVSFATLWQTEEYKNIANIERVQMGDTVHVYYEALGVDAAAEVIRTKYDCLLERYTEIELGTKRNTLSQAISSSIIDRVEEETASVMQKATAVATNWLTNADSHIYFVRDGDDKIREILFLDGTEDPDEAQNVMRLNSSGIGFSSTGVDGEYRNAFVFGGDFGGMVNADLINTGHLNANLLTVGTIQDQAGKNSWNLVTGDMTISAESFIDTENFVTKAELQVETDRIASEVVEQVGSGIFFNCMPTDNANGTTTIIAHVYLNRNDATHTFAPYYFRWYKKTEDGKEYLGYGYEITVDNKEYGYGGEIEAVFVILEDRYPINRQGKWLFNMYGSYFTMATSQGTLMFYQGHPLTLSDSDEEQEVHPVFGYDYY